MFVASMSDPSEDDGTRSPLMNLSSRPLLPKEQPEAQEIDKPPTRRIHLDDGHIQRIFHAEDAYAWGPIAVWGGIWLASSFALRYCHGSEHPLRKWRVRISQICATAGMIQFCEYGCSTLRAQYLEDPSMRSILSAGRWAHVAGAYDQRTYAVVRKWGLKHEYRPIFDTRVIRREILSAERPHGITHNLFSDLSWRFRHFWSSRETKIGMSFWLQALYLSELLPSSENVLRHMPTNLGLSAHDLDLCVTYLANELEAYKAETWGSRFMGCYISTYFWGLEVQPRTFLSHLRRVSFWGMAVTMWLRPWVQISSLKRIRDKGRVANILQTAKLAEM